ncbi:hypothetical protein DFQ30_009861, partial [Apophysomyces sp. BC1015]
PSGDYVEVIDVHDLIVHSNLPDSAVHELFACWRRPTVAVRRVIVRKQQRHCGQSHRDARHADTCKANVGEPRAPRANPLRPPAESHARQPARRSTLLGAHVEQPTHRREQFGIIQRLAQECVVANERGRARFTRYEDKQRVGKHRVITHRLAQCTARHLRHAPVSHDDIGFRRVEQRKRVLAIAGSLHPVALLHAADVPCSQGFRVIVDKKYSRHVLLQPSKCRRSRMRQLACIQGYKKMPAHTIDGESDPLMPAAIFRQTPDNFRVQPAAH